MLNKRFVNKFAKSSCALRNRRLYKWQVGLNILPDFHFICHFITLLFTDCPFCHQQSYHQGHPTEFHYLLPTPRYLTGVCILEQAVARVYSLWNIGIPATGVRRGQPAGRRRITRQTEFVPNLQPLSLFRCLVSLSHHQLFHPYDYSLTRSLSCFATLLRLLGSKQQGRKKAGAERKGGMKMISTWRRPTVHRHSERLQ